MLHMLGSLWLRGEVQKAGLLKAIDNLILPVNYSFHPPHPTFFRAAPKQHN